MKFHCGNENDNPFINNSEGGVINRKTMYGFGIPSDDMFLFKGKVTFGKIRKRWKCLICEFGRSRYGRNQVFCLAAAQHGYKSRGEMADGTYLKMKDT